MSRMRFGFGCDACVLFANSVETSQTVVAENRISFQQGLKRPPIMLVLLVLRYLGRRLVLANTINVGRNM